jgi:hypothetical protein
MDMMNQSLFLVGEIGGNDYNIPLLSRVPFEKIRTFTPSVVNKISSTITVSHLLLLQLLSPLFFMLTIQQIVQEYIVSHASELVYRN